MSKIFLLELIYRGSYVVAFFFTVWFLRAVRRRNFLLIVFWWVVWWVFIWSRFIEPQQIQVKHTTIDVGVDSKVVLISDLHLGVFKDRVFLQKVVNQINRLEGIDMVLIAGDFTFEPLPDQPLDELFAPLRDLRVPVYAVLGNHDVEHPWPDIRLELIRALERNNVTLLNNDIIKTHNFLLVGLGDRMNGEDETWLLNQVHPVNKVIVLTHNPDTTLDYNNNNADVTLAGHTHCGQIRLPWIHERIKKYIIPVEGDFDKGLSQEAHTRLYITCGIGESVIPMRRRNKPSIDIISLWKKT